MTLIAHPPDAAADDSEAERWVRLESEAASLRADNAALREQLSAYQDFNRLLDGWRSAVDALPENPAHDALRLEVAELTAQYDLDFLRAEIPKTFERTSDGVARVTNIVKAMKEFAHPDAGRDVSTGEIKISTAVDGDAVIIRIFDNGCGVPPENLSKLYDPFFTIKEVGRGTGQGLAITHSIVVDKHAGHIGVSSSVGTGTLRERLYKHRHDWNMKFVVSGAEAIAAFERQHIDLVVSDVRMMFVDDLRTHMGRYWCRGFEVTETFPGAHAQLRTRHPAGTSPCHGRAQAAPCRLERLFT
jgi:CheY-like chemotaxis protein